MADKKISQLTSATVPLAGTEVLPIVQAGSTVKVPVSDLTAGRSPSMSGATVTGLTASKPVFTDANKALTSSGTVPTDQGGTGLTSFTSGGVPYAASASALTTGTALQFDGKLLGVGATVTAGWRANARGVQFGVNRYGAAWEQANGAVNVSFAAYESSNNVFSYTTTGDVPTLYSQLSGAHIWSNAVAGTAGNTFTFTERMRVTADGNVVAGGSVALATTATNGFLYVPTCAGTPTGTPTSITGMAPIVVDTTNNKMYFYSGGQWRDAGP